jgi:hypothetical protein
MLLVRFGLALMGELDPFAYSEVHTPIAYPPELSEIGNFTIL